MTERHTMSQFQLDDQAVDAASDASFPASDPPPWTLGPPELPAVPLQRRKPSASGANGKSARAGAARGIDSTLLARVQGGYLLATGLWPLLHLPSFERATGGKRRNGNDRRLIKTVGMLTASIGIGLLTSARGTRPPAGGIKVAATLSALGFIALDVGYVATRQVSPIHLLDAAFEAAVLLGWSTTRS